MFIFFGQKNVFCITFLQAAKTAGLFVGRRQKSRRQRSQREAAEKEEGSGEAPEGKSQNISSSVQLLIFSSFLGSWGGPWSRRWWGWGACQGITYSKKDLIFKSQVHFQPFLHPPSERYTTTSKLSWLKRHKLWRKWNKEWRWWGKPTLNAHLDKSHTLS